MLLDIFMTNLFISNSTNQEDIQFASQVVGYIGGVLVVAYNLPQLIKMIRTKSTDDVSMLSLIMQFVLNLIYIRDDENNIRDDENNIRDDENNMESKE